MPVFLDGINPLRGIGIFVIISKIGLRVWIKEC